MNERNAVDSASRVRFSDPNEGVAVALRTHARF